MSIFNGAPVTNLDGSADPDRPDDDRPVPRERGRHPVDRQALFVDSDSDGDGIPDAEDDSDGDGIPDHEDTDDDNDGVTDDRDTDDDGDGIADTEEDTDGDGIPNSIDTDDDNDGIPDDEDDNDDRSSASA